MNSTCSMPRVPSALPAPLQTLLGYEGSLVVGTVGSGSPGVAHHNPWACAPPTSSHVKQEPMDHDSSSTSGVSSVAHGFLSASNTSPSSGSSAAGSPGYSGSRTSPRPQQPSPDPMQTSARVTPPATFQNAISPAPRHRQASPDAGTGHPVPFHSTPARNSSPGAPEQKLPRTPGSVDDNSRSSCTSEEDGDDAGRRGIAQDGPPFQCRICNWCANNREELFEHVGTHYDLKCSLCDYTAGTPEGLRAHLHDAHDLAFSPDQDDHADNGFLDGDDDGVATPKMNAQGKVKTFRCKQCDFVAVTKLDFWEHSKIHIKHEKLLTCPKCPFVTEYKHHLEYHLRNHFNSKPFKCDKCPYSCVNKSMLNSHLKSHSNVYQYHCADCSYATKYCHSLKLHLRKYNHSPSMVLNPDGTPNPLPIIDVYGTRRGPKTKTSKAAQAALQQQQHQQQQQQQTQPSQSAVPFPPPGIFPTPYALSPIFPYAPHSTQGIKEESPMPSHAATAPPTVTPAPPSSTQPWPTNAPIHRCNYCDFATQDRDLLAQHVFVHAESNLMQYFQAANNNNYYNGQEGIKEYLSKVILPNPPRQSSPPRPAVSPPRQTAPRPQEGTPRSTGTGTPLDLSKPEGVTEDQQSTVHTKNRRKGRAFKLERIALRLQQQPSEDESDDVPPPTGERIASPVPPKIPAKTERSPSPPKSPATAPTTVAESYNCTYCDISFKDIVMYTMHQGYHGYQDPFQCNMCGQQTSDKVAFFLHIARSSHS